MIKNHRFEIAELVKPSCESQINDLTFHSTHIDIYNHIWFNIFPQSFDISYFRQIIADMNRK
jgi:hypothetical protein